MDKKLNDLLIIDQEIGEFFRDNEDISDDELNNLFEEKGYVAKALKIINKLSSKNVLELIKRNNYLNIFIDLKQFIKKYPINKKHLLDNKDEYIDEYHKLHKTCSYISDISLNFDEFNEYMKLLDIDNVERYLLTKMPNNQIYMLANEAGEWTEKLFLFSYLKKEKSN